jgi:hypothetical protein
MNCPIDEHTATDSGNGCRSAYTQVAFYAFSPYTDTAIATIVRSGL